MKKNNPNNVTIIKKKTMTNFKTIDYLSRGNQRQKQAYKTLKALNIFEALKAYTPILTGTVPIDIDIPTSDLDIICCCMNHEEFQQELRHLFADKRNFELKEKEYAGTKSTIARFDTMDFEIEIFGQQIPTEQQHAYQHMLIEYAILRERGLEFKQQVRALKLAGLKTEPAFAQLLGLEGNPYEALLTFNQ